MLSSRGFRALTMALGLVAAGCGGRSERACVPGSSMACTCTTGRPGAQICKTDGSSYDMCVCSSSPGAAGNLGSGGMAGGAGGAATGSGGMPAGAGGSTSGAGGSGGAAGGVAGGAGGMTGGAGGMSGSAGGMGGSAGGMSGGAGGMSGSAGGMSGGAGGMSGGAGGIGGGGGTGSSIGPACGSLPLPAQPLTLARDELARRLARLIWAGQPDTALLQRVSPPMLDATSTAVRVVAEEMLRDPRAVAGVDAFANAWIDLSPLEWRTPTSVPSLDAATRADMGEEMLRRFRSLILDSDGTFPELLVAPTTVVNARLAPFYDLPAPPAGWSAVVLDPVRRAGFATQLGWLTARPLPTYRGVWIRDRLLCQPIPPPPSNHPTTLAPTGSYRTRLEQTTANVPVCRACHASVDPLGFAFEHFDDIGRYRTTDSGYPVDSQGSATLPSGATISFDGPQSLMTALASSCDVQRCFVRSWLGVTAQTGPQAGPSVDAALGAFSTSGLRLRTLIATITETPVFLEPTP